jgi:hypothetical protein
MDLEEIFCDALCDLPPTKGARLVIIDIPANMLKGSQKEEEQETEKDPYGFKKGTLGVGGGAGGGSGSSIDAILMDNPGQS